VTGRHDSTTITGIITDPIPTRHQHRYGPQSETETRGVEGFHPEQPSSLPPRRRNTRSQMVLSFGVVNIFQKITH